MQTTRIMSGQLSRKASLIGARGAPDLLSSSVKAGVSSTSRRMMKPITITMKLSRKGMRQPQELKASAGM